VWKLSTFSVPDEQNRTIANIIAASLWGIYQIFVLFGHIVFDGRVKLLVTRYPIGSTQAG
jgi:hypothetical protein